MFENMGIPHEVVLFFGIMQICDFPSSASSFCSENSELDISSKDDGDTYAKKKYFKIIPIMSINTSCRLIREESVFIKRMPPLFCVRWFETCKDLD